MSRTDFDPSQITYDARGIANFVLDKAQQDRIEISNMAINKIVYFAQAVFLSTQNKPLISQPFEAWEHGPIVQDLYHSFKKFGENPIAERAKRLDRDAAQYVVCDYKLLPVDLDVLTDVVDFYVRIPALKLSDMSHAVGGPWHKVWHHGGKSNPGMRISNAAIQEYYVANLRHYWSSNAHPSRPIGTALRTIYQS